MAYRIDILDQNLNYKGTLLNTPEIDKQKTFLQYGQQLSKWGTASFRVATKDPLFATTGDLAAPLANHVRIYRDNVLVWSGVIARNKNRNNFYIDVEARTYEWFFEKVPITADGPLASYPDDGTNFQHFLSGGIDAAISLILSNAKTYVGSAGFLNQIALGTVVNPTFPGGWVDANGNNISGQPWDFSKVPLKYSYETAYYVLNAFGVYSKFDFNVDLNNHLNFTSLIGTNKTNLVFSYGGYGNIETYNLPMDGDKYYNNILGLAADDNGDVLICNNAVNNAAIAQFGKVTGVAAYNDIKAQQYLNIRAQGEVEYRSNMPFEMQLTLNSSAFPIGQWGIGDIITATINDHVNQVNAPQQVVRYNVIVKTTGTEEVVMYTNTPLPASF